MYVCQWILNIVTQKEPGIPMKGSADVQTCLCRCLQIKLNDIECNESQRSWEDSWCEVRRSGQNWRQIISFSCECEEKVCGNLGVIKRRHAYALLQSMAVSRGRVTGPSSMGPYGQGGEDEVRGEGVDHGLPHGNSRGSHHKGSVFLITGPTRPTLFIIEHFCAKPFIFLAIGSKIRI